MTEQNEEMITGVLEYLKDIPQMKHIFENLPDKIAYKFSEDTPGIASYDSQDNAITIKPNSVEFRNPQEQLSFYVTLAHELCHANQKKEGLYYDDLSEPSFGDTFRIAKMMETDTRLFGVIIENELLKRNEFQGCTPSIDCQYYQKELQRANGNVPQANTNFVLSYWQNAKNNDSLNIAEKETINSRYFFYAEQAYHQARLIHDPEVKKTSTNRMSATDSVRLYAQRMSLTGLPPKLFLHERFDGVQTTGDFKDGITILHHDGSKYLNLAPTNNLTFDKVSFFENNRVAMIFLKNGMTGDIMPYVPDNGFKGRLQSMQESPGDGAEGPAKSESGPPPMYNEGSSQKFQIDRAWVPPEFKSKMHNEGSSQESANLSALQIAIENKNMDRMHEIISKDPSVINRQHICGKNFPLLMAIQNDNAEAVSLILSKNPNLLLHTEDGKNVLTELPKLSDVKLKEQIETLFVAQKRAFDKGHKR